MANDCIDEVFEFDAPKYFDFSKLKPMVWTEADDIFFKFKRSTDPYCTLDSTSYINQESITVLTQTTITSTVLNQQEQGGIEDLSSKFDLIEFELDHWFSNYHPTHSPKKITPPSNTRTSLNNSIPSLQSSKETISEKRASIASKKKLSTLPSTSRILGAPNRKISIVGSGVGGNTANHVNRISIIRAPLRQSTSNPSSTIPTSNKPILQKKPLTSATTISNNNSSIKQASKSKVPIKIPEFTTETTTTKAASSHTTLPSKKPPIQPAAKKFQNSNNSTSSKPPLSSTNVNSNQLPAKLNKKIPIVKSNNTTNTIISIKRPISIINNSENISNNNILNNNKFSIKNMENKENLNEIDYKNNLNILNNNNNMLDIKKTCKLTITTTTTSTVELNLEDSLKELLDQHNKKFMKQSPILESTLHSVKDVKMWEDYSGKRYQELSIEDRQLANQWILDQKKKVDQPKFVTNINSNRQSIF